MKKLINDFIKKYGIKVRSNESSAYVELMMDDHKCIEYEDGKEYYIPENSSSYSEDDELIREFIIDKFGL